MKRNPGEWLRERLLDRWVRARLHGMVGLGWLMGAGCALWAARGPGPVPDWAAGMVLLPGAAFLGMAMLGARRGWRPADMRKGARAEERVGQAIEYALTSERCAVAHHVEGIARIGDIDHLAATPGGLWVIETKHGRVPERRFRETLRRIAANAAGVRDWAPGVRVTGCLVFASRPRKPPKPAYEWAREDDPVLRGPRVADAGAAGGGARRRRRPARGEEGLAAGQEGGWMTCSGQAQSGAARPAAGSGAKRGQGARLRLARGTTMVILAIATAITATIITFRTIGLFSR